MFTLCTTAESVTQAVSVLAEGEYIILDCEGRDLGSATGALSLISVGTPHASNIYLFDVLMLPHHALQLLFNSVLSLTHPARSKTKVVWDGRMDYAELFFSFTCPIENVLDLQLADVLSRAKRGLNDRQRVFRLARRVFPISEIRKLQLEEVHALNGMDGAVREHRIDGVETKNESVKKLHMDNLSDIWMQRPLSTDLLEYAASDIRRIASLHDHFLERGYLEPAEQLCELSARYVSMHRMAGKPEEDNIFLRGPYLPLSVSLSGTSSATDSGSGPGKHCSGCRRAINVRHFPFVTRRKDRALGNGADEQQRSSMCKICTFVLAKAAYIEKQKATKTSDEKVNQVKVQAQIREG